MNSISRKTMLWIVSGVVLAILGIYLLQGQKRIDPFIPGSTPSWQGIIPGKTDVDTAVEILGPPDQVTPSGPYQVYEYHGRRDWGWENIQLWLESRSGTLTVVAVLRSFPFEQLEQGRLTSLADIQTLEQLVSVYRQPEKVAWYTSCFYRYLIWNWGGISAAVYASKVRDWKGFGVMEVLIFEPQPLSQFLETEWPWITGHHWTDRNRCSMTDAPDTMAEDPYDWNEILNSLP